MTCITFFVAEVGQESRFLRPSLGPPSCLIELSSQTADWIPAALF